MVMAGEHIYATATREVLEETGVQVHVDSVITMRHYHGYKWHCSDLYVVCAARAALGDGSAEQVRAVPWFMVLDDQRTEIVAESDNAVSARGGCRQLV